ncbi:MAG: hypothetical protein OIF40_06875 [Mangrovicoccus sp.]|nr:hypothetical protein [Mangrovicoccus sp.]
MTKRNSVILGVHAPTARPTIGGALWLATLLTLPVALATGGIYVIAWLVGA